WGLSGSEVGWNLTNVPVGLTNVTAIAAGVAHTLALKSDGTVVAWGAGQTNGGALNYGQSSVPSSLTNVIAIAAGGNSSLGLRNDGTIVCWGQLSNAPSVLFNVVKIGAGDGHCMAVRTGRQLPLFLAQPVSQCALPSN